MSTASASTSQSRANRLSRSFQSKPDSIEPAKCPLCESQECHDVKRIPSARLIEDWRLTFEMDIADELKGIDEVRRVQCDNCEFQFFWPMSLAGSGIFYEKLQRFDWYYMKDKWEHQLALPLINEGDSVLEVGSAEGAFLSKAKAIRHCNVTGLELNRRAAELANEIGIDTSCIPLNDYVRNHSNQYDVVCSFQVLEHVEQPGEFIRDCIAAAKPGGIVIFGVPNEDSFLRHEWTLLNMPPHHVSLWQAETFQRLSENHPVSMLMTRKEPLASYHVDQYIAAHSKHFRQKSWLHKVVLCKPVRKLWRRLLRSGWHQKATGQTLFVALQKDES